MIEDGRVRDSMQVIVGKPETPSPALKSVINFETLNPYWHVFADLAKTLIAPRVLHDGVAYLTDRGYEVLSGWGPDAHVLSPDSIDWKAVAAGHAQVYVRQLPGPANSLGHFKFDLRTATGYLHYTPRKRLFARTAQPQPWPRPVEDAQAGAVAPSARIRPSLGPRRIVALPHAGPIAISSLDAPGPASLARVHVKVRGG